MFYLGSRVLFTGARCGYVVLDILFLHYIVLTSGIFYILLWCFLPLVQGKIFIGTPVIRNPRIRIWRQQKKKYVGLKKRRSSQ